MFEVINRVMWSGAERRDGARSQRGQGLVEYGLILILVSVAVVVALTALSGPLNTIFDTIKNDLNVT